MNQQPPSQSLLDLTSNEPGAEGEEDLSALDTTTFSQAVVFATDWTAETILRQLEKGNIWLDPGYQRRDAWRPDSKSRFIESLLLGLPIPQLVLAEASGRKGSYIVIDGKQRLLALRQFAARQEDEFKPLRLTGLTVLTRLNGSTLREMEADPLLQAEASSFQNQPIRTVVLRNWPNEDFLYLVFLRLNTGSVQLSPQELRQALHPGGFVTFTVERSARSKGLQKYLRIQAPDFRMRDVELLVRFYAFEIFIDMYTGNLKWFMDMTCKTLNARGDTSRDLIMSKADEMELAIETTFEIFGDEGAFRKWDGDKYQNRRNRAVFDIMLFYFSKKEIRDRALVHRALTVEAYQKLCGSSDFVRTLEATTKSMTATQYRLTAWGEALSAAIDFPITLPKIQVAG